jgi:hypothetical protein
MTATMVAVAIEGLELADWEAAFRAGLAAQPGGAALVVDVPLRAGALGARRSRSVRVSPAPGQRPGEALQVLGLVISALSLTIAAVQFGRDLAKPATTGVPPPPPPFVCRVEGPQGVRELRIAGIPSEAVLRKCLDATGTPVRIKALPPPRP